MSFHEYLASWLNCYPSDRAWVDAHANFALRQSEAAWLGRLRAKPELSQDDMEQLVTWKFGSHAARAQPLTAVRGDRYGATARVIAEAIAEARNRPDDDTSAVNMVVSSVSGFGFPMTSVFLALYFPYRFTIADRWALKTLRVKGRYPEGSAGFTRADWAPYVAKCQDILAECRASGVVPVFEGEWTLRCVDQALWAAKGAAEPAG